MVMFTVGSLEDRKFIYFDTPDKSDILPETLLHANLGQQRPLLHRGQIQGPETRPLAILHTYADPRLVHACQALLQQSVGRMGL